MRVSLVCPYSLSEPGGVQEQVVGLTRALRSLGHTAVVVAPGDVPHDLGTTVGRAFRFRVNGSVAPLAPHPAAMARTVRALRRGGFDVIHLQEPLAPSVTIPALLAHPAPVVGTFHAAGHRTPYWWLGSLPRSLAGRIDARVAVSEPAAELARHHLGGSYELLFNGIDVARFRTPPRTDDGRTVLFLGRHEPRKGLDVLLRALPSLPVDVDIRVAGDGVDTARLRQRHRGEPRISWLGRLTDDQKITQLRAASVLCAPSLHGESFGMVLLEAMAAGTPIVASDVPGYRALRDEGGALVLVPPGDPIALAAAVRRVLSDRLFGAGLSAAGSDHVRRFSMDELARRYLDIYKRVSARSRHIGSVADRRSAASATVMNTASSASHPSVSGDRLPTVAPLTGPRRLVHPL